MKHYYFIENESGEEFLVGADTEAEAWEIAMSVAEAIQKNEELEDIDLSFEYEMDDEEAEASGLDEY